MRRSFSIVQAFAWTFAAALGLQALLALLNELAPAMTGDLVTLASLEGLVFGLVIFLVYTRYVPNLGWRAALGVRPTHPGLIGIGLLLGVVLQAPADTLQAVVESLFGPAPEDQILQRALLMRAEDQVEAAMMMLSTGCLVPIVEELMFRGVFFGALLRTTTAGIAALVTGAAFVVCHLDTRIWLPLALVATVMSGLRWFSGSVLPSIALHMAFNAVTLMAVLGQLVPVDQRLGLPWQAAALGWLAAVGLSVAAWQLARRSVDAERARAEDDHGS